MARLHNRIFHVVSLLAIVGGTVYFLRPNHDFAQTTHAKPSPAELWEMAEQDHRELEKRFKLHRPQFTDYNRAPAETLQRVRGKWEVIQFWQGRWCTISKDRDRRRGEFHRQLVEFNDHLMTRIEQRVWDGKRDIKSQYHVAFDPQGAGTVVLSSHFRMQGMDPVDEKEWAIADAARRFSIGNNDRGIYRFEGNRLLLYSVNLSAEGKALPTPTSIPELPPPASSNLLVLQRIDPQEPYPPADIDLELARQESLRNDAMYREAGMDKPMLIDKNHPLPRRTEWLVTDPKDLPESFSRWYEERYGKP